LEHGKWPIAGCQDGHLAGISALFLKEAAGKFSKTTVIEAFEAAGMIAKALPISSI
jgi:hypothetical protein